MARSVGSRGDISQSVIITGDGSSASLRFGDEFVLPLDRRQIAPIRRRQPDADYNPLPLLVPDANALPLVGRKAILAELRAWLNGDADISVRTLIARAGTGKTRLAIELCKAIDGARKPGTGGWNAGFIRPSDLAGVVDKLATQSFGWERPTFLVVDYAAAVHRELARWLDRLAGEAFSGKLRLLLLDREAPEGFGWWSDLTRPSDNRIATRRDLFVHPDRPQLLPDLDPGEERRALFEAALAATTAMMGDKAPGYALPESGINAAFDATLAGPRFGNPLNLAMAGLIAAERGAVAALALRRLDAARHLARHELVRMKRIAVGEGVDERAMRHALGFNGLAGGLALRTLRANLSSELKFAGLPDQAAALADIMMQELPSPGNASGQVSEPRLGTIQPDLIGEAVIVEALLAGPPDRPHHAVEIVERGYALTGDRAAEALMRLIQDYGYAIEDPNAGPGEREVAQAVLLLLTGLADAIPDDDIGRLETLVNAFPEHTTILREAAAEQTQRLARIFNARAASIDDDFARACSALWHNNLANRLSDLGQREPALAAAQEAVDIYRVIAATRPDAVMPELATALCNLAVRLAALGQRDAALLAGQEGVDLCRSIAIPGGETFAPDLAMSLNNLANLLSDVGRHDAALAAAQETADLYRALAEARPDAFMPDLAMSLGNLASRLSAVHQLEAALAAGQEAAGLYRALAAAHPDAFTPDLATSLNNLANRLGKLGQREAALAVILEAVDVRRVLAAARPDAFKSSLAGSLNNLATILNTLDQNEAALPAALEAVKLRRELAATHPDAFTPDLAMSLSVLADQLEGVGRLEEAVAADHQSVSALSPYFLAQPGIFAGPMVTYLRDYLRRADAGGIEVDEAVVGPIIEMLKQDGGDE